MSVNRADYFRHCCKGPFVLKKRTILKLFSSKKIKNIQSPILLYVSPVNLVTWVKFPCQVVS